MLNVRIRPKLENPVSVNHYFLYQGGDAGGGGGGGGPCLELGETGCDIETQNCCASYYGSPGGCKADPGFSADPRVLTCEADFPDFVDLPLICKLGNGSNVCVTDR